MEKYIPFMLWFDVEERYNTTIKTIYLYQIRCGLM